MASTKDYLNLASECEESVCTGNITSEITKKIEGEDVAFVVVTYKQKQYIIRKSDVYICSDDDLINVSVVLIATKNSLRATVEACAN